MRLPLVGLLMCMLGGCAALSPAPYSPVSLGSSGLTGSAASGQKYPRISFMECSKDSNPKDKGKWKCIPTYTKASPASDPPSGSSASPADNVFGHMFGHQPSVAIHWTCNVQHDSDCVRQYARNLQNLSNAYAGERNRVMDQRVLLDVPVLGLAVAAIANPIFDGANASTKALGLGAAAFGGMSLYFADGTKVTAYNTAANSLRCAAAVGRQMANEVEADSAISPGDGVLKLTAPGLVTLLRSDITTAAKMINSGKAGGHTIPTDQKTSLFAAAMTANVALASLVPSVPDLETADTELENFAYTAIGRADNSVVGAAQQTMTVVNGIKNTAAQIIAPPGVGIPGGGGGSGSHSWAWPAPPSAMNNAAMMTKQLTALATAAAQASARIDKIWSALKTCTPAS